MFITKKHLSRRTLLRGAGASIALPLLDAMITAGTALAQTAAAVKPRLGFFYFPHGAIMDKWTPSATGAGFELTPILKPLGAFKDQMAIVSNLRNTAAEGAGHQAGESPRQGKQDATEGEIARSPSQSLRIEAWHPASTSGGYCGFSVFSAAALRYAAIGIRW